MYKDSQAAKPPSCVMEVDSTEPAACKSACRLSCIASYTSSATGSAVAWQHMYLFTIPCCNCFYTMQMLFLQPSCATQGSYAARLYFFMLVVANSTIGSSLLTHFNGCFVASIQPFEADDTALVIT